MHVLFRRQYYSRKWIASGKSLTFNIYFFRKTLKVLQINIKELLSVDPNIAQQTVSFYYIVHEQFK